MSLLRMTERKKEWRNLVPATKIRFLSILCEHVIICRLGVAKYKIWVMVTHRKRKSVKEVPSKFVKLTVIGKSTEREFVGKCVSNY